MKQITFNILFIISLFAITGIHTGCKPPRTDKQEKLSVTIDPQKYFLESIVGDKFSVNCIVPSGANPESFDVAPSQMMTLGQSKIYFQVGHLSIENTLVDKISQNNPNLKIVNCSDGLEALLQSDHDHANCGHHHNHGHSGTDPHIWSSPATARIIIENMYNAIIEADSLNKEFYTGNYEKLLAKINETDEIIKSYIAKAPSKTFIIYHPALSYFAEEYGLEQLSIEYEGKNPSPVQMKDLIDEAKKEGVKVVFIQQEYDSKNAETVAQAIGGKTVPINLLSYYWNEEMIKVAKALALEWDE